MEARSRDKRGKLRKPDLGRRRRPAPTLARRPGLGPVPRLSRLPVRPDIAIRARARTRDHRPAAVPAGRLVLPVAGKRQGGGMVVVVEVAIVVVIVLVVEDVVVLDVVVLGRAWWSTWWCTGRS